MSETNNVNVNESANVVESGATECACGTCDVCLERMTRPADVQLSAATAEALGEDRIAAQLRAQEAQGESKEDGAGADVFARRAAQAFARGNTELLLSRLECGYWCHEFYSWRLAHGFKDRGQSSKLLAASLAPYAESERDVRPDEFARWYGIAVVLGALTVEVSKKGTAKLTFGEHAGTKGLGALSISKLDALSPLVIRPEGSETYAHYFAPEKAGERAAAVKLWADAVAEGKGRIGAPELKLRATYLRDPAQGRSAEMEARVKKAKTAEDYAAIVKWAEGFPTETMLADGRSVISAALKAQSDAFPAKAPAPAAKDESETPAVKAPKDTGGVAAPGESKGAEAPAPQDEDEDEDEDESNNKDDNPADARGTVTGNILNPATPYTAKDAAEFAVGILTKSDAPDDALEALLLLVANNKEFCQRSRRAAGNAAKVIARGESHSPVAIAEVIRAAEVKDESRAVVAEMLASATETVAAPVSNGAAAQ